ncbi:MAG: hypothetical protein JSR91_01820 [Proteobacteria bacterium]|nr:hypothetical protein [Pseudomonadota bacterium]
MANPTDTFPSDLDVSSLLALLNGIVPSMPSPSPSWGDYVRTQYGPDPSLVAVPASDTPGFHKSPAVLDALAAANPRPPGFYRSPALLGASATAQGFDPSLAPTIGPQEMLFGGPGLPTNPNAPLPMTGPTATSPTVTPNRPSLANSIAAMDAGPPSLARSLIAMGYAPPTADLDPSLQPTLGPQEMLFGGPGLPSSSNAPSVGPGLIPTGFSIPSPPPMSGPQATLPTGDPSPIPAQASPQPSIANGRGTAPPVEPPSNSLELEQQFQKWPGQIVRLPNGLPVLDPKSPTGYLMSPFGDISDVAAAGRRLGSNVFDHVLNLDDPFRVKKYVEQYLLGKVGQGGTFDYQRRAYPFGEDGFTQLRQFRNVSNFNVGLITQQAGIPLAVVLWRAGGYAAQKSNNYTPDQPFGLDPQTREWIERGYHAGKSGVFDRPNHP